MKKTYESATYEITFYHVESILTLSSDRENAYVPSEDIWKDFTFDDDDD